jgi:DNA-binding transcriptional ArsR family regulator
MVKSSRVLTDEAYARISRVLQQNISGPFRITDVSRYTGYDLPTVSVALRRLRKEGSVVSYRRSGRYTLYIKSTDAPKMEQTRFRTIMEQIRGSIGGSEFTPALIARSLDVSFEEAQQWFAEAGQRGLLEQTREGSRWAKMKTVAKM